MKKDDFNTFAAEIASEAIGKDISPASIEARRRRLLLEACDAWGGRLIPGTEGDLPWADGHAKGLDWTLHYDLTRPECNGWTAALMPRITVRQPGNGERWQTYAGVTLGQALTMAAFAFVHDR